MNNNIVHAQPVKKVKQHKFRKRIRTFFENIRQIKKDKENRQLFVQDITNEMYNMYSEFNMLHLVCDEDKTTISAVLTIPDEFQISSTDTVIYGKLREMAMPINRYINNTINWGEYFTAPEFYYVEDEDDYMHIDNSANLVSRTYVATWRYEPVLKKFKYFWLEFGCFCGVNTLILGALITLLVVLL